jgi:hypothetical protein
MANELIISRNQTKLNYIRHILNSNNLEVSYLETLVSHLIDFYISKDTEKINACIVLIKHERPLISDTIIRSAECIANNSDLTIYLDDYQSQLISKFSC